MLRHAILITRIPWVHVCELLWSPRIQIQEGSPLKKWVGIIAIKTGRTQIYFLSDVLVAIVPLDLKVPYLARCFESVCQIFFYWTRRSHLLVREKRNRNMFLLAFMDLTLQRIPVILNLRTTRNYALIYFKPQFVNKTKDCQRSGSFQHKLQHRGHKHDP